MRVAIVLALTLCFLASAMGQTCNRPGTISIALFDSSIFLDTSRAYNGGVCDGLFEQSCCTEVADNALTTLFEGAEAIVTRYEEFIATTRNEIEADFDTQLDDPFLSDLLNQLGLVDEYRRLFNDLKNAIVKYLDRQGPAFGSCLNGINAVRAWGLCSLCNPDLSDFASINSNDQLVLQFHPDTCTDVAGACVNLYTNTFAYLKDVVCALNRFVKSISSNIPQCGSDCQAEFGVLDAACDGNLDGFFPNPGTSDEDVCFGTLSSEVSDARAQACGNLFCDFLAANFESGDLSIAADGFLSATISSDSVDFFSLFGSIFGGFTKANVDPALVESLTKVTKVAVDSPNRLARFMAKNQPAAAKRDATGVTTETNANAPQAYDEGTNTPLYRDNTVDGATTATVSLAAMALVVVVAALF